MKIIYRPTTISAKIATTLIRANQNSISPNNLTVAKFMISKITSAINPGIHCGTFGNQNCVYNPTAVISAMAMEIQQNQ
ncbi:hypothetical protein D3C74_433020 [compost metagenome]